MSPVRAGSTWQCEMVFLTLGYQHSEKSSGCVFFLKALNIDYIVFITWMNLKMLL